MDWLDPLDTAMMAAEVLSGPLNIGAVLVLRPPPDAGEDYVDDLHRDAVSGQTQVQARLRRYPHRGVQTGGAWVWREAATIELARHCRRIRLAPGSSDPDLWRLIGRLHAEPIDRSRPMWMSYLIDGFGNDRFAFYVKAHHTIFDGVAGFRLIADALSSDPDRRSMPHFYAAQHADPSAQKARTTGRLPNPLAAVRSMAGAAVSSLTLARRVAVGEISDLMAMATGDTTVAPWAAPVTRFNGRLGPERSVVAGSWPRARIRAVQDKAGVTGNDVVTAVVAAVLRHWMRDRDELPDRSLVAICPITVRSRSHAPTEQHNNMFGAWLCPLGTDLDDPVERLHLIHRSMSVGKARVAERGAGASLVMLAAAIGPTVLQPMLSFIPSIRTGYNLPISHVPGPSIQMYWNGAHVQEIYPVSAVYDGQALNVTTCTYADRIGFGYVAGSAVLPDIDTLVPLTEQALAELEAALRLPV